MTFPLVSVICLCYNQDQFLIEALDSVLAQTYPNIEIIVADDASTDQSVAIIENYCFRHPKIQFIKNQQNIGNCKTFNRAFAQSKGKYIIDFAADDILLHNRVTEQVQLFEQLDASFGVIYTDAELIDENSKSLGAYYTHLPNGTLKPTPYAGYIYEQILKNHFISAPTMMMKRTVLEYLGGYDEALAYEDFDFWVRSAKIYQYYFYDKILTQRRLHDRQLSRQRYKLTDKQLATTVKVCYKAYALNRTTAENRALAIRVQYELKHAYLSGNFSQTLLLLNLLEKLQGLRFFYRIIKTLANWRWSMPWPVYQAIVKMKRK